MQEVPQWLKSEVDSGNSWFRLGSDGRGSDSLIVPAGGARLPFSKKRQKIYG